MPKNALGIMDTSTGQVTRIERVKSFQVPEDGSGFIAYLLEAKPEAKGSSPTAKEGSSDANPSTEASPNTCFARSRAQPSRGTSPTVREGSPAHLARRKKKDYGSDLVLRNLSTGTERTFNDALDYTLSKDAKTLVYAVSSKKEETNGIYAVTTQTDAAPAALLAGKGKYLKPTWDEEQTELAFISDRDDAEAKQPKFKVYLWNRKERASAMKAQIATTPAPPSITPLRSSQPPRRLPQRFCGQREGLARFFAGRRASVSGSRAPTRTGKESGRRNSRGRKSPGRSVALERRLRSAHPEGSGRAGTQPIYRAVYLVKDKKFVQLADEAMESVSPSNDGRYAIGADNPRLPNHERL